jgi:hypothetical protein
MTTSSSWAIDELSSFTELSLILKYLRTEAMFLMILGLGTLASMLYLRSTLRSPLALLGRYGLFAFVLHRFIGHTTIVLFNLRDGGYLTFLSQFITVLTLTYFACLMRVRVEGVDRFFSKSFL